MSRKHPHAHDRDHGHSHDHDHDHHHDHSHGHHAHSHAPPGDEPALAATPGRPIDPGFSLLALGAAGRLIGAALLSGIVWIVAFWAVSA